LEYDIADIPIFIINLKQDSKKKKQMQIQLDNLDLKAEFFEAVNGNSLTQEEIDRVYQKNVAIREFKRELSRGEIGCALSHLSIYKKMIEQNIEKAVILEDDAVLCKDFPEILQHLEQLPEDAECLLFGYDAEIAKEIFLYTSFWGSKKYYGKYRLKKFVKVAFGTYGYMITRQGAEKLLKKIKIIDKPIDHYTGGLDSLTIYGLLTRCISVAKEDLENSSIVNERNELKKALYAKTYNHWWSRWLNRIRLGIRLYILKTLPLPFARYYSMKLFRNRRKEKK